MREDAQWRPIAGRSALARDAGWWNFPRLTHARPRPYGPLHPAGHVTYAAFTSAGGDRSTITQQLPIEITGTVDVNLAQTGRVVRSR